MDELRESPDPHEALVERVRATAARLEDEGRERREAAKKLASLIRQPLLDDLEKLAKQAAKIEQDLSPERAADLGVSPVLAEVEDYVRSAESRIRSRLGRELKEACAAAGVGFAVMSREDPVEVRLPPLLVRIDFRRGRADLLFARETVATASPEADAILAVREKTVKALERDFEPERFFDDCVGAYRAALGAAGRGFGERVELIEFLPYLAVAKQTRKFRASPAKERFRSYGKAHFAYDVLSLRRSGTLSRGGYRMSFGVATGSTATQKDRVVYMEDEHGEGEYKLTVFFTPTGER